VAFRFQARLIANLIRQNRTLIRVVIYDAKIDDGLFKILIEAMLVNNVITEISMSIH